MHSYKFSFIILFAVTPTTFPWKEPIQSTRPAHHRLGPPNQPGRRTTFAVFSPKTGLSSVTASLLLLRAGDIESNPEPNYYACGNLASHNTSPMRCTSANCPNMSHKQFLCSGFHRSNLRNRLQCLPYGATVSIISTRFNPLRKLPKPDSSRH